MGTGTDGTDAVIDTDVHHTPPRLAALYPYLPAQWVDQCVEGRLTGFEPSFYPPTAAISARPGSRPDTGPPGSDPDLLVAYVLGDRPDGGRKPAEPVGRDGRRAVLTCLYAVQALHNADFGAALARAVNDWTAAEWLDRDPRLLASVVVAPKDPQRAAEEIRRCAADRRFVQVLLLAGTAQPLGQRAYWPVHEAAEEAGLALAVHPGVAGPNPPSPVGWTSHHVEDYANGALAVQSQLTSLVAEGVFSRFPGLRVLLLETGVTWLPSLLWRFDKNWRALRREVPWVDRRPSEIVRERVRLSVAPFDAPRDPDAEWVGRFLDRLGGVDQLAWASDYPHWHARDGATALLAHLDDAQRARVLHGTAAELYGVGVTA